MVQVISARLSCALVLAQTQGTHKELRDEHSANTVVSPHRTI